MMGKMKPEIGRLLSNDKANGVHEIRLPGAIGPNDGRESLERTDGHLSLVRLEVLHFQLPHVAHDWDELSVISSLASTFYWVLDSKSGIQVDYVFISPSPLPIIAS